MFGVFCFFEKVKIRQKKNAIHFKLSHLLVLSHLSRLGLPTSCIEDPKQTCKLKGNIF